MDITDAKGKKLVKEIKIVVMPSGQMQLTSDYDNVTTIGMLEVMKAGLIKPNENPNPNGQEQRQTKN